MLRKRTTVIILTLILLVSSAAPVGHAQNNPGCKTCNYREGVKEAMSSCDPTATGWTGCRVEYVELWGFLCETGGDCCMNFFGL